MRVYARCQHGSCDLETDAESAKAQSTQTLAPQPIGVTFVLYLHRNRLSQKLIQLSLDSKRKMV